MLKDATILRSNRTGKPPERWETIRLSPLLSPCARLTLITTDVPDETASLEHIHCIIELVNQHGHTHTHTHAVLGQSTQWGSSYGQNNPQQQPSTWAGTAVASDDPVWDSIQCCALT